MDIKPVLIIAFVLGVVSFSGASSSQAADGKKGERPNREEILKKFDKDGDGKLSEAERSAAREARANNGGKGPGGKGKPGFNREEFLKKFGQEWGWETG